MELYAAQNMIQTRANNERALFNIHLKGEKSGYDRTRAVVNENAAFGYERNCDASKFMNPEASATQVYILNDGVKMAIDERPLGNGDFLIGTKFGKSGNYTLSLDTKNAENYKAILIDTKTGVSTDLSNVSYDFKADEGTDNTRFILNLRGIDAASVDKLDSGKVNISINGNSLSVTAPEVIEISVISADGKVLYKNMSTNYSAELPTGIYVVKAGEETAKVVIGK